MTQPAALFLADILEDAGKPADIAEKAAAELRRLYLVEQALDRCRVVCDATSEGWRADAERWRAQRDALLEALEDMLGWQSLAPQTIQEAAKGRAAALRAALAGPEVGGNLPPPLQERNFCPRCGKRNSGVHTCTPPSTEPQCNPHPKAPHGFLRNASHTEDRYVCECEYWDPYEAGYQAGMEAALRAQS